MLLFWLLHTQEEFDNNNNHLLRFVIFWRLCVRSDDKASNLCFRLIREMERCSLKSLYQSVRNEEWLSRSLICPKEMENILVMKEKQPIWMSLQDKIKDTTSIVGEFVDRRWNDGANVLPWLQRN